MASPFFLDSHSITKGFRASSPLYHTHTRSWSCFLHLASISPLNPPQIIITPSWKLSFLTSSSTSIQSLYHFIFYLILYFHICNTHRLWFDQIVCNSWWMIFKKMGIPCIDLISNSSFRWDEWGREGFFLSCQSFEWMSHHWSITHLLSLNSYREFLNVIDYYNFFDIYKEY